MELSCRRKLKSRLGLEVELMGICILAARIKRSLPFGACLPSLLVACLYSKYTFDLG